MSGLGIIIILLVIVVSFGLMCILHKDDVDVASIGDKILVTLMYGIGIFVGIAIITCIHGSVQDPVINPYNKKYELVAFNNKSEQTSKIKGNFVLGCGSINGSSKNEQYYYYLQKDNSNNIEFKKINVFNNSCTVYLKTISDNDVPYIVYSCNEYVYTNTFNKIFSNEDPRRYEYETINVTFFVPENSIKYDINFDINDF